MELRSYSKNRDRENVIRIWREIGWYPRYYACLDLVVGVSHKEEIERLIRESAQNGIEGFLLRRNLIDILASDVRTSSNIFDFDDLRKGSPLFAAMPITTGSHATLFGALLGNSAAQRAVDVRERQRLRLGEGAGRVPVGFDGRVRAALRLDLGKGAPFVPGVDQRRKGQEQHLWAQGRPIPRRRDPGAYRGEIRMELAWGHIAARLWSRVVSAKLHGYEIGAMA